MKITPPEPLSSEERALATMLARVAPHGVPSPEIDASILSASHDAVAGTTARARRPRWPVAMGVAASMVLAVGVAWQLRPTQPDISGPDAAPVQAPSAVEAPEVAAAPAVEAAAPPDLSNDAVADMAAPRAQKSMAPTEPQPPVVAAPRAAQSAGVPAPMRTPPAPPAPPAPAAPAAPAYSAAAAPAASVDAAQRKATTSAAIERLESARQAEMAATGESDSAADAGTTARRELRVAPTSERVQENAPAMANGAVRARRTDLQVPVAADAQLQVGDWLERVRTRYGLGDEDAARRSLLLFVQDHPTEAVPDDLEPLLDE